SERIGRDLPNRYSLLCHSLSLCRWREDQVDPGCDWEKNSSKEQCECNLPSFHFRPPPLTNFPSYKILSQGVLENLTSILPSVSILFLSNICRVVSRRRPERPVSPPSLTLREPAAAPPFGRQRCT